MITQDTFDNELGIRTRVHETEGRVTIEKQFQAQPLLDAAAEIRAHTAGDRWGEMRHVGLIPMAELGKFMRQDGGFDRTRVLAYLKRNQALVTFDKFLKD